MTMSNEQIEQMVKQNLKKQKTLDNKIKRVSQHLSMQAIITYAIGCALVCYGSQELLQIFFKGGPHRGSFQQPTMDANQGRMKFDQNFGQVNNRIPPHHPTHQITEKKPTVVFFTRIQKQMPQQGGSAAFQQLNMPSSAPAPALEQDLDLVEPETLEYNEDPIPARQGTVRNLTQRSHHSFSGAKKFKDFLPQKKHNRIDPKTSKYLHRAKMSLAFGIILCVVGLLGILNARIKSTRFAAFYQIIHNILHFLAILKVAQGTLVVALFTVEFVQKQGAHTFLEQHKSHVMMFILMLVAFICQTVHAFRIHFKFNKFLRKYEAAFSSKNQESNAQVQIQSQPKKQRKEKMIEKKCTRAKTESESNSSVSTIQEPKKQTKPSKSSKADLEQFEQNPNMPFRTVQVQVPVHKNQAKKEFKVEKMSEQEQSQDMNSPFLNIKPKWQPMYPDSDNVKIGLQGGLYPQHNAQGQDPFEGQQRFD